MVREQRYIVIKLKDMQEAGVTSGDEFTFNEVCDAVSRHRIAHGKQPLSCVVVESDWPEYEPVWGMIEARVDGATG